MDVRDHEKLCGEPIECKCGLKFAFKCNLVAHKKAHPACQDQQQPNISTSAATHSSSSSDDSEQSLGSPRQGKAGCKRGREDLSSPSIQSSLHVPIPNFKGLPDAPEFKMARHDYPGLSFPPEANPLWASNMVYPTISFTNLPVASSPMFSTLGDTFQGRHQQFSSKPQAPLPPYEAVNCEMGIAFNQLPFKAWSG